MSSSSKFWNHIWSCYNDYVNNELMFDSPLEEILGFALWASAHFAVDLNQAEEFLQHVGS